MDRSDPDPLPFSAIPGHRASILGVIWEQVRFDRDPLKFMYALRAKHGDLSRVECRLGNMLIAFGPEYNRALYQETDLFHSRPFVLPGARHTAQHRLRQSIFSLNGEEHKRMRHHLRPIAKSGMVV